MLTSRRPEDSMTVNELSLKAGLSFINRAEDARKIKSVYMGDLLSWVMGRAGADSAWITIMSNVNVVAVALLADVSCVILAEGVVLDAEAAAAAKSKSINILSSSKTSYETAIDIYRAFGE